ncbi:MAG: pantothenate kinase [Cyanobacteria bacterium J06642_11]
MDIISQKGSKVTAWLSLVIGNTHWHWAWFNDGCLQEVWHLPHRQTFLDLQVRGQFPDVLCDLLDASLEIWAVSVVPSQAKCLDNYSQVQWIQQISLEGTYPTMGIDRIVSLWGAGQHYGWPVLVIDGGTALTFTAGAEQCFKGGAILLGLRSHLQALHDYTAALPVVDLPIKLPPRWATNTPDAIQSGVLYLLLAGIHDFIEQWQYQYPDTAIVFTGGDGQYLRQLYQVYLTQHSKQQNQALNDRTWFDANLMFWGIAAYRKEATRAL